MLVLSRREGESIVIGTGANAVKVTVVRVKGQGVRIGIEAPKEIPVARTEIYKDESPAPSAASSKT